MKIYVSAAHTADIDDTLQTVRSLGHQVISTWHEREMVGYDNDRERLQRDAQVDRDEVTKCDCLILDNREVSQTGGAHTETGMAIALGKRVIVVGDPSNVFHFALPCIDLQQLARVL